MNFDATWKQAGLLPSPAGMDLSSLWMGDFQLRLVSVTSPPMGYKRNAVGVDLYRDLKYHWPPRKGNTSHVIGTPEWACKLKLAVPEETVASGGSRLVECVQCARSFINMAYCLAKETTWPSHVRDVPIEKSDDDRKLLWEIWETVKQDVCKANLLKSKRRDHIRSMARNSCQRKGGHRRAQDESQDLVLEQW